MSASKFVAVAAAGAIFSTAMATDRTWLGATGIPPGDGTSFNDPLNWNPNGVPASADNAIFNGVGGNVSYANPVTVNKQLIAKGVTAPVTLHLNGHVYHLSNARISGTTRSIVMGPLAGDNVEIDVQNGTLLCAYGVIGSASGAAALLVIDSGATLDGSGTLSVGDAGQGTLTVNGVVIADAVSLGDSATGDGTANVDGAGALLLSINDAIVGETGTGTINATNGGLAVNAADGIMGHTAGSVGHALVDGAGSSWITSGSLWVAGDSVGPGGSADVMVTNGGGASASLALTIYTNGTVVVDGATVQASSLSVSGGSITLMSGATASFSDTGTTTDPGVWIGLAGGTGSALLDAGASMTAEAVTVGGDGTGTLTVQGSATLTCDSLSIAKDGALVIDQGSATVNGSGTDITLDERSSVKLTLAAGVNPDIITSSGDASLAGKLELVLPGGPAPTVGTTYGLLKAADVDGECAITVTPLLPSTRMIDVHTAAVTGGKRVTAKVIPLSLKLNLNRPTHDDLPAPPNNVVAAPFGGDPTLVDAAVTIPGPTPRDEAQVIVLTNTLPAPGGPPGFTQLTSIPVDGAPVGFGHGDFDRDHKEDLVVSSASAGTVTVIRNHSSLNDGPPFSVAQVINVGGALAGLGVADIDGDGAGEIIVAQPATGLVIAIFNNGAGTFTTTTTIPAGVGTSAVDPIDLDGDKDVDLCAMNTGTPDDPASSTVSVIKNKLAENGGTFDGFFPAVNYQVGPLPVTMASGDLNGDGFPEIVTGNSGDDTISVLVNKGDGTYFAAVNLPAGGTPKAIGLLDLVNDVAGNLDIAVLVTHPDQSVSLTVYRNDTTDDFLTLTPIFNAQTVFGVPAALVGGNANSAGPTDLITAGAGEGGAADGLPIGAITVFVSKPISCVGGMNGDDIVDGADLGFLLASWGPNPGSPADLDGNGVVDAADLAILLANWGPCQ